MKFLSIILALNLFLSSTGIPVFSHICSAKGTSIGVYAPAEHCCTKKLQKKQCCKKTIESFATHGLQLESKPCCTTEIDYVKAKIDFTSFVEKSLIKCSFVCVSPEIHHAYQIFNFPISNQKTILFDLYNAPPNQMEILSFVQSYRC